MPISIQQRGSARSALDCPAVLPAGRRRSPCHSRAQQVNNPAPPDQTLEHHTISQEAFTIPSKCPDGLPDSKLAVLFTGAQLDEIELPTVNIIREETRANRHQSPGKRQRTEFETNLEDEGDGEQGIDWQDDRGTGVDGFKDIDVISHLNLEDANLPLDPQELLQELQEDHYDEPEFDIPEDYIPTQLGMICPRQLRLAESQAARLKFLQPPLCRRSLTIARSLSTSNNMPGELAKLPSSLTTLKCWLRAQLPLLTMRKKRIPLGAEMLGKDRQGEGSSTAPAAGRSEEDLYFYDPVHLSRVLMNSDITSKMHVGFGEFRDQLTELWHGHGWRSSIRTTAGNFLLCYH
ncbi:hypothetical protein V8E54_007454 [Elaphomyces granulatus]